MCSKVLHVNRSMLYYPSEWCLAPMLSPLHPAPLFPLADVSLCLDATVAVAPLATEGKLDAIVDQAFAMQPSRAADLLE